VEVDDSRAAQYRRSVVRLPKTRTARILRCVLKEVTIEWERGDIATIEDEGSVSGAAGAWQELRTGFAGAVGRPDRYKGVVKRPGSGLTRERGRYGTVRARITRAHSCGVGG
jgi:hypothetical protein